MANNISFGGGNGGGGSSTLSGLSDVTLSSPTNGQVLKYDGSKWVNGAGGGSSEHNYSTTEQVVGTWIDGSTIYEKTVYCGALPNNASVTVAHNIANMARLIDIKGNGVSTTSFIVVPYVDCVTSYITTVYADTTYIHIVTKENLSAYTDVYVTLTYTKSST